MVRKDDFGNASRAAATSETASVDLPVREPSLKSQHKYIPSGEEGIWDMVLLELVERIIVVLF